jgi:hypothetical protein
MKGKPNVSKKVGWNLFPIMAKNNIRTAAELSRRLKALGIDVTSIYLSRMMNERPGRLNTDLLDAFITLFNCTVSDLLPVIDESGVEMPQPATTTTAVHSSSELPANVLKFEKKEEDKKKRRKKDSDVPADILGPDIFALPTDVPDEE